MRKLHTLKKWYTVQDAAKRLSITLGEPIEPCDILALMADRELKVFWFVQDLYAVEVAPVTWIRVPGDPVFDLSARLDPEKFANVKAIYAEDLAAQSDLAQRLHGLYLIEDDVCKASSDWITSLATGKGGEKITLDGTLLVDDDGRLWKLLSRFDESVIRTRKGEPLPYNHIRNFHPSTDRPDSGEVVVSRAEMERFEARFAEPTGPASEPDIISTKERVSLQKQVAALATLLAEKSAKYRRGERPNAKAIADEVALLLDAMPDVNRHGVGASNIRASISTGIDLLTS